MQVNFANQHAGDCFLVYIGMVTQVGWKQVQMIQ